MKDRYRIFRRGCGIYYLRDRVTLRKDDKTEYDNCGLRCRELAHGGGGILC